MDWDRMQLAVIVWGLLCAVIIHGEMRRVLRFGSGKSKRKQRDAESGFFEKLTLSKFRDILPTEMYVWYYAQIAATVIIAAVLFILPHFGVPQEIGSKVYNAFLWASAAVILIYYLISGNFFRDKDTPPRWMKK